MRFFYILRFLLLIFVVVLLSSCGDGGRKFVVGVSQCSDDGWRQKMNGEILRETFLYGNVDVEFRSANDSSEKQIQDIKYFIHRNVDILIVAPNEAKPLTKIIETAYDMGIPVVVVDRKIESDKFTAFVGADNEEIGRQVGKYIISRKGKENVDLVELRGLHHSTPAKERHSGFMQVIGQNSGVSLVADVDAGWIREDGYEKMDSILESGTNVDFCFAQNDMMALGAFDAAKKHGLENKIKFIGVDAIPGEGLGLEAVGNGDLLASFSYPTGGDKVMQICMDILEGRAFKKETVLRTSVVDGSNVENILLQSAQIGELDSKMEKLNGRISNYISRYYTQKMVLFCILVILLLLAVLLIVMLTTLRSKSILNNKLSEQKEQLKDQYEQMVELSKQLEEATQAKLMFFTNISHDFRTPLTLIVDPVEQLLASENIGEDDKRLLSLVKKNTDILLRLVNQILDFRKYENGKMEFKAEPLDLRQCFLAWSEPFSLASKKKHIHFDFICRDCDSYITVGDKSKLESVFFNLVSNAFKYTPENGRVSICLEKDNENNQIRFSVENTGSLISKEHIDKIFDRFYKTDLHHSGSGIGLALAKAFVEMHRGIIQVDSSVEHGTVFTVALPVIKAEGVSILSAPTVEDVHKALESVPEEIDESAVDSGKETLLVIDDNQDIRTYVKTLLKDRYTVIEAADGLSGIRKASKYVPDLIICDVMMPGIDGYECCHRLKSEMQTSHIPVILLTACSLVEQRVKGYAQGADSYISKPFTKELLLSRIENLIVSKKRLKEYFGDSSSLVKEDISNLDKDFVGKFRAIVEKEIENSELSVEDIGKEMGMSRVQLYRKMKSLTNYSPNELIRITRLKKAYSMLSALDITVSEVAYKVGFSSPSYFAKCYKDYFGESPASHRTN